MSEIDYFSYNPKLDINQEYQLNQIQEAANDCTYQRQFGLINLGLSEESIAALDAWHLNTSVFGSDLYKEIDLPIGGSSSYHNMLQSEVYPYIQSISDANSQHVINQVADEICRIVDETANGLDKNYAYKLQLRLVTYTKEGSYYQDWHIDQSPYDSSGNNTCPLSLKRYEMLFSTALLGQRTSFYVPSAEIDAEITKINPNFNVSESGNRVLAREFINSLPLNDSNVFSAPFGYGTVHMYGSYMGSIHQIPMVYYDGRVFMGIKITTCTGKFSSRCAANPSQFWA